MKYTILLFILLTSCATAAPRQDIGNDFQNSWNAQRCQTLLDQRDSSMWGAAFGGGLTGVAGLSTAFPENDNVRLGLGLTSAVIAAAATSLTVLAKMKSTEFEQYCNLANPVVPMENMAPAQPVVQPVSPPVVNFIEEYQEDAGVN